jgi:flagellar biogenesis protein FliO
MNKIFNDDNFDFNNELKTVKKVAKFAALFVFLQIAVSLTLIGAVIYVIVHFLSKFW